MPPQLPPADIPAYARRAETAGFDELWLAEDCFFAGGIAAVSAALSGTERLAVGLGIMPAVARNAAFTAMEAAALAGLYAGRVMIGLGHGMADWMRQIGAYPRSPLTALSEHIQAVRALLAGQAVSMAGEYVRLDGVRLDHPPAVAPGAGGRAGIALAGVVRPGRRRHDPGLAAHWRVRGPGPGRDRERPTRRRRTERHLLVGATPVSVDPDPDKARDAMRAAVAAELAGPTGHIHVAPLGIADQVVARLRADAGSLERFAAELPDRWIDQLVLAGPVAQCADRIAGLADDGINHLLLSFPPALTAGQQDAIGRELIAALGR